MGLDAGTCARSSPTSTRHGNCPSSLAEELRAALRERVAGPPAHQKPEDCVDCSLGRKRSMKVVRTIALRALSWAFALQCAIGASLAPSSTGHPPAALSASDSYDEGARLQKLGRH